MVVGRAADAPVMPRARIGPVVAALAGVGVARAAGRPGLSISGDGRSCDTNDGRSVVTYVHADSAGNLDRLWVLYEYDCGHVAGPALFGEIRLGEPAPCPAASAEPPSIRW